jgi:hypothetical protein
MSGTRYLELDSTYRNRKEYPEPASFVADLGNGLKMKDNALDPVCDSSPILVFNTSFLEEDKVTTTGQHVEILYTGTDPTILNIRLDAENYLRQVKDFYVGSVLYITISSVQYCRRIISYEPLGKIPDTGYIQAVIQVNSSFPGLPVTSGSAITGGEIVNPTPYNTDTAYAITKFYIPSGSFIDNFYVGYYIQCTDLEIAYASSNPPPFPYSDTYRKIIAYDGVLRLATLDSTTTVNWLDTSQYLNFSIRKQIPLKIGAITGITPNTPTNSVTISDTVNFPANFYKGDFIRFISPVPATTPPITGGLSTNVSPYNEEIAIIASSAMSSNNITLTLAKSITSADATVYYEIEPFSKDNYSPIIYTGSQVSSQEMVCYEVELLNLILPNLLLESGRGGRTAFYPYLYVELQPIADTSAGAKGLIYSNNPNSYKMLFRAIVDDIQQPFSSAFVKIGSDGMAHTMKFRPNTAFKFGVYQANGELFQTVLRDTHSPTAPNPLVQISAVFSFKRA